MAVQRSKEPLPPWTAKGSSRAATTSTRTRRRKARCHATPTNTINLTGHNNRFPRWLTLLSRVSTSDTKSRHQKLRFYYVNCYKTDIQQTLDNGIQNISCIRMRLQCSVFMQGISRTTGSVELGARLLSLSAYNNNILHYRYNNWKYTDN